MMVKVKISPIGYGYYNVAIYVGGIYNHSLKADTKAEAEYLKRKILTKKGEI